MTENAEELGETQNIELPNSFEGQPAEENQQQQIVIGGAPDQQQLQLDDDVIVDVPVKTLTLNNQSPENATPAILDVQATMADPKASMLFDLEVANIENSDAVANYGNVVNQQTAEDAAGPSIEHDREQERQRRRGAGQNSRANQPQVKSQNQAGRSHHAARGPAAGQSQGHQHPQGTTANQTQLMYRTNPRKQEPVMGIGPGGSDVSKFFAAGDRRAGKNAGAGVTDPNLQKPQTAGAGSLIVDSNEFGLTKESKLPSYHMGPNITNIGFDHLSQQNQHAANMMMYAQQKVPGRPTSNQSRTGSFTTTAIDRSKSFHQQRQRQQVQTGEYTDQPAHHPGSGHMKPFIQGSSLQRPGTQNKARTSQGQAASTFQPVLNGAHSKKPSHQFLDYNFFSQKLNQHGIPKNQEIKYRKEMQQLKFYQTLNNYPYIVQQQQQKQQMAQQRAAAQAQYQSQQQMGIAANLAHQRGGVAGSVGQMRPGRSTGIGVKVNATTQIDDLAARESRTDQRSTKQTVYQMHSSRKRLHGEAGATSRGADSKILSNSQATNIRQSSTVNNLNAATSREMDLRKHQSITAEVSQQVLQANTNPMYTSVREPEVPSKLQDGALTGTAAIPTQGAKVKGSGAAKGPVTGAGKPSIVTHETDVQGSTNNASSIEQRAVYDNSPKLLMRDSSLKNTTLKATAEKGGGSQTLPSEFGQPAVIQTKKVAGVETGAASPLGQSRNTVASKNAQRTATAVRPTEEGASPDHGTSPHPIVNKMPVERIEIKQQTVSAGYLAQMPPRAAVNNAGTAAGVSSQPGARLLAQASDSAPGTLMIRGSQVKPGESKKEIGRVRSQKPIAAPLISKREDSKTVYWRVPSRAKPDDGQTLNLLTKDGGGNADITHEVSAGIVALHSQTAPSEEMLFQKTNADGLQTQTSGFPKKGTFEEQVSGVAVDGLFSVWGPSSQQTKLRPRKAGKDAENSYGDLGQKGRNTADGLRRNRELRSGIGLGLDGVEPSNMAHHMQLVNSIINDGSLHNLVFSNGSLNTRYLEQNKSEVAKLMSGHSPVRGGAPSDYADAADEEGEDDDEYDEEEDDDEQIIVTMLKSMNAKKLSTCELKDMKLEVDIEKLRSEIKLEFFKGVQAEMDERLEDEWRHRLAKFDRLFNKIISEKLRKDTENAVEIKQNQLIKKYEERRKNPFYVTLKLQKEERDKFIDFYQSGSLLALPQSATAGEAAIKAEALPTCSEDVNMDLNHQQFDAGDLFQHTRVDIADEPTQSNNRWEEKRSISETHLFTPPQQQGETTISIPRPRPEEIFCFYDLVVDIPKAYFEKLGDPKIVSSNAVQLIKLFCRNEWPILAKRKRLSYRVSYDFGSQVFNAVPLGKDAPLSRCCMRNVNFVFGNSHGAAGRVLCMEPFCAKATLDTFEMTPQLIHSLFSQGLQPPSDSDSQTQAVFMGQRKRMQIRPENMAGRLGRRYQSAVSYALSKRITAGNHKTTKLQKVVTNRFQQASRAFTRGQEANSSSELVDMIMNVNVAGGRGMYSGGASQSMSYVQHGSEGLAQEIYNENQMLAELIQRHSVAKQRHKASLPISKLMKAVPHRNAQLQTKMQRGAQNLMVATEGSDIQTIDWMGSERAEQQPIQHQTAVFGEGMNQMYPKFDKVQYQDQERRGANTDILDATRQEVEHLRRDNAAPALIDSDEKSFQGASSMINTQLLDVNSVDPALSSFIDSQIRGEYENTGDSKEKVTGREAKHITPREGEESNTVGQTMMTAGGLDIDPKYSHSKSPVHITAALSKDSPANQPHAFQQVASPTSNMLQPHKKDSSAGLIQGLKGKGGAAK